MPKKTPVNSSHSAPDSFTNGPHTASPNCLLPCFNPCPVCRTCAVVRAACCRTPEAATVPEVAAALEAADEAGPVLCFAFSPEEGFGEVAASTAVISVFAAARAPTPSARPNRTESIPQSVAAPATPMKGSAAKPATHRNFVASVSQRASYFRETASEGKRSMR
jgi:hypothetical protein